MPESCPKCGARETGLLPGGAFYACGSYDNRGKSDQSDRCKLTATERERDEWKDRAFGMSLFLPEDTLCGDLQKARDGVREMRAANAAMLNALRVARGYVEMSGCRPCVDDLNVVDAAISLGKKL